MHASRTTAWVLSAVALGAPASLTAGAPRAAPAAYAAVDPFIGTGGEGHTFPGAVM